MAAARPFTTAEELASAADACWDALDTTDVLEAFAAHPKIGQAERGHERLQTQPAARLDWSAQEQAGVNTATADVHARLDAGNRAYEARFGYIFIICASGKTAEEMLASLEQRLYHTPSEELRIAAAEQRKIMHLRLARLVEDDDRHTP